MIRSSVWVVLGALAVSGISGCAPVVVAGGAAGASAIHDRRTVGKVVADQEIEIKAMNIRTQDPMFEGSHINIISFNGVVLLTGEAPTPQVRQRMEEQVRGIEGVRRVQNEVIIAAPSAAASHASDAWITTKAKASLLKVKMQKFDPTRVKVHTENGTVYLMGLVTRAEADAVVEQVRQLRGVQRVVKVFEYIG